MGEISYGYRTVAVGAQRGRDAQATLKTRVKGLDDLISGGLPAFSQVLLAGGPGTGKTLLTLEIAYKNAKQGINSAFISLEESKMSLVRNFKLAFPQFSDIDDMIENGKLIIEGERLFSRLVSNSESESYSFGSFVAEVENIIVNGKCSFAVVDSVSLVRTILKDGAAYRRSLLAMLNNMRRIGVTSICTLETGSLERQTMNYTEEFFLFDGIIALYQNWEDKKRGRSAEVIKMRGSNHTCALVNYAITPEGFVMGERS